MIILASSLSAFFHFFCLFVFIFLSSDASADHIPPETRMWRLSLMLGRHLFGCLYGDGTTLNFVIHTHVHYKPVRAAMR
ncbi:Cytochrome c-type biogenesis protein CcmE [Trichinella spiralis]|uniref:Cytochrome c-type biogenesis protein CcmE n=1 Tax=Trichinella spiralis TaxID=6334 RepID=A0ABR3KW84_TRISP